MQGGCRYPDSTQCQTKTWLRRWHEPSNQRKPGQRLGGETYCRTASRSRLHQAPTRKPQQFLWYSHRNRKQLLRRPWSDLRIFSLLVPKWLPCHTTPKIRPKRSTIGALADCDICSDWLPSNVSLRLLKEEASWVRSSWRLKVLISMLYFYFS